MEESNIKKLIENPELARKMPIGTLAKVIKYASDKYYNTKQSILSDELFDFIRDILKERSPKNKVLTQIGAPIQDKEKVKLPFHMGSLDKIKPNQGLDKWVEKFKGPYTLSDKLDGISGLLVRKGSEIKLYTRGDGTNGTDITYLIPHIKSINIEKITEDIAIRGELVISKIKFKKYENEMANTRNMVAGVVNAKSFDPKVVNDIDFVCYEYITKDKHSTQLSQLKKLGLNVVQNKSVSKVSDESLLEYLEDRKKNSIYDIDGIVVFDDNIHPRNRSGNPDYGFAFKSLSSLETADVEVLDIEWNLSKDGLIKPVVKVVPTKISGVVISNVTGHNAKNIVDNKISKGAIIQIVRSGDVIPYIMKIIKPASKLQYPEIPYKWNETKVDLVYDDSKKNEEAEEQLLVKNLNNFFRKIGTKWMDENTIIKFVNSGYTSVKEIIDASVDDLLELEGFKDKMAEKIYNSIQESLKDVELVDLMAASNIFGGGLGERKLGAILKVHPNIIKMKVGREKLIELIKDIDGFDDKTAIKFADGIQEFKDFLKELNIPYKNKFENQQIGSKFKDMKIVFTGFRNAEWEATIENEGGKMVNTVSKNTSLVVCTDKNESSSKLDKAKTLKVDIMTKEEFNKKYNMN
jgi:NAD-dependent DNA ligase